jgi:1,4-alpha-glucan branching enzyme
LLFKRDYFVLHPACSLFAPDRYSAKKMSKPVNFVCVAPLAKAVYLTGEFNAWDPLANPMHRQPDGAWLLQIPLHHGHHQYRFVVDGKPVLDPRAQGVARNRQGERASLIAVS